MVVVQAVVAEVVVAAVRLLQVVVVQVVVAEVVVAAVRLL